MSAAVLRAERLGKSFGSVEAVKDATFEVHPDAITCFLGENGAGKTTVLKLLLGFLRPDWGRFSLAAGRVGYVPERPAFFPWLRGDQILRCTARAFGLSGGEMGQSIDRLCRWIPFDRRLLGRKPHTYSLGNQKKFSYLQSLFIQPDLLIVDEPFSALDPISIKGMRVLFRQLRTQGKVLLLSSHLISELEKVCDEFIVIKSGRILVQDDISRLRSGFFLVNVPKSRWKQGSLDLVPSHISETEGSIRMLVAESRLRISSVSWPEGTEIKHPDLESLYFFYSSL